LEKKKAHIGINTPHRERRTERRERQQKDQREGERRERGRERERGAMHLYNAWLPPQVAEETKRESESFASVVRSVTDSWRPDDPDSIYSTLKWISVIDL